jgi:hypothetical protein
MLRHRQNIPLDYSLCQDTVTVYHREGLTRHILRNVRFEQTRRRTEDTGKAWAETGFLLIVPGGFPLHPGDRIAMGEGAEITSWQQTAGLPTVETVKDCHFRGKLAHTEARG